MDAVVDVITPRQVATIMEEKLNIPIAYGPSGTISRTTFDTYLEVNGNQNEEFWHNMKFFYQHSDCRGDPRDARKLIASEGLTLASVEDGLKELNAAGAFNL